MFASAIDPMTIPATMFHLGRDMIRATVVKAAKPPTTMLNGTAVAGSVVPAKVNSSRSDPDWMSAQDETERITTVTSSAAIDSTSCRVRLRISKSKAAAAGKIKAPKPLTKFVIKMIGAGRRLAPCAIS